MEGSRVSTENRLRVTIVGPVPPPVGGVETVTKTVLESEALQIFNLRHCDTTKGRPKHTQGKFDAGNAWWALIHFWRLVRNVTSFRPAVIYMPVTATWSGFWRDAVLAAIGQLSGAKVIGHVHGAWFDRILARRGFIASLVRLCLNQYDALLMLGTPWKRLVERYGYRGEVSIVPPTVAHDCIDAAAGFRRDYATTRPRGVFVGQVGARKGVFELLWALHELKRAGKTPSMTIVGGAEFLEQEDKVIALWKQLGLQDAVRFTGSLSGASVYEQLKAADYFVLPSYSEGLPISILEAGMFGLPVITTPVGAVTDLVEDQRNGLLVPPGDVNALREAINRLLDEAELRMTLGQTLQTDVRRFEPENVCRRIAAAIEKKDDFSLTLSEERVEP